ncbi:MAG: PIN domain-containing protein [Thermodesulfovibrionales bacterium]|nr:PIN domain-containing protein [Thermodesulfovibrionales bacterium]
MIESISKVFCDTSFFYAVLDKNDFDHERAISFAQWIKESHVAVLTTWEVVIETVTLLRYRLNYNGAAVFIKTVLPNLNIIYISDSDRAKALETFLKLSRDKKISLCDAVSYTVIKEHLEGVPSIAFDADFRAMGLRVL